jgi:serine/threonine protein kinase
LGIGGIGEVYRAYDTKLKRSVALKRIVHTSGDRYRERLWAEARYASHLTDPRIAAVYDVFEEGSELFLVMEYVEGQTLRNRLAEPLSIPKFLDIAIECAEALSAAHRGGVLHHDIKPENIMLTSSGQVKVLDFGVARHLPDSGAMSTEIDNLSDNSKLSGTLAYMAPEVLEEKETDERADIFSLGVIFYEALAGRHPFLAKGFLATCNRILHEDPASLRSFNPYVSPEFERIATKALAKDPAERYLSAADLLVDLRALRKSQAQANTFTIPSQPSHGAQSRKWPRLGFLPAVVGLACLAALGIFLYRRNSAPVFTAQDWMLVTDFENHSGEPLFDETVGESISHALQQSRYLHVVPRPQAVEAARLAGRNDVGHIDSGLGQLISQRENYRAVLVGDVEKAGSAFEITVKVIDPKQGTIVLADSASFKSPSELYNAVDDLAKRLRSHLGESLPQIEQQSTPLARVTTPSLEALKRYSAAMKRYTAGDAQGFLSLANSAVELDPGFAMAHLDLARVYYQLGNAKEFRSHMAQARNGLDHVSERERFLILAEDYSAQSLLEKSLEQYRLLTELYPEDLEGLRGLAEESVWVGRPQDAVAVERHILQINPHSEPDYVRLILWLNRTNQFPAALEAYSLARTNGIKAPELHWVAGFAYLGEDNADKAREQFTLLAQEGGEYEKELATLSLARVLMYQGRLREAAETLRTGMLLAEKVHTDTWIPVYRFLLVSVYLLRGQSADARAESQRLVSNPPHRETEDEELRTAGLLALEVGDKPAAQNLLARLARLNETQDNGFTHSCYYNLKGAVELAGGKPADAEESQRRAAVFFPLFSAYKELGNAFAAQRRWDESAQADARYLDFRGELINDDSPTDWVLGNLRLAQALAQAGQLKDSLKYYDEFLRLWANADPDLPVLRQAREEQAKILRSISPGPVPAVRPGT